MKKIISMVLTCVILTFMMFSGVGCQQKKSLPHKSITQTVKESFLYKEENRINFSYKNKDYDPTDPDSEEYLRDRTLPSRRGIIITSQTVLDEALEDAPTIDFETKMVVIILFTVYGSCWVTLEYIEEKNDVLEITINKEQLGGSTQPELFYWVIEMDKLDIKDCVVSVVK